MVIWDYSLWIPEKKSKHMQTLKSPPVIAEIQQINTTKYRKEVLVFNFYLQEHRLQTAKIRLDFRLKKGKFESMGIT